MFRFWKKRNESQNKFPTKGRAVETEREWFFVSSDFANTDADYGMTSLKSRSRPKGSFVCTYSDDFHQMEIRYCEFGLSVAISFSSLNYERITDQIWIMQSGAINGCYENERGIWRYYNCFEHVYLTNDWLDNSVDLIADISKIIVLPSTTRIGKYAFGGFYKTEVYVPRNTQIEEHVFDLCKEVKLYRY